MNIDTALAILQQSEYELASFSKWYNKHKNENQNIKPQKWTLKLKLIKNISLVLGFLPIATRFKIALILTNFPEFIIRNFYYSLATFKLIILKSLGLKIVAIAGSYAKTSTKLILQHNLTGTKSVVITPDSINTLLGIAQIILQKVSFETKNFIVEFGEFDPDDIKQLSKFSKPDLAIITPIGRQHVERFGSVQNIAKNIEHLLKYFSYDQNKFIIAQENKKFFDKKDFVFYGKEKNNQYQIANSKITRSGTEFEINIPGKEKLKLFTPLYGEHQAINILPSFWVAEKLGIDFQNIIKKSTSIPFITRRHEPTFAQNNVLILDNSYNTNPDSATASLKLIGQLEAKKRLIITMGFIEQGKNNDKVHREFGKQLAKAVDYVGLAKSDNAKIIVGGFVDSGGNKNHIVIGETLDDALSKLSDKIVPGSLVLFEGGYQEMYT